MVVGLVSESKVWLQNLSRDFYLNLKFLVNITDKVAAPWTYKLVLIHSFRKPNIDS